MKQEVSAVAKPMDKQLAKIQILSLALHAGIDHQEMAHAAKKAAELIGNVMPACPTYGERW